MLLLLYVFIFPILTNENGNNLIFIIYLHICAFVKHPDFLADQLIEQVIITLLNGYKTRLTYCCHFGRHKVEEIYVQRP